MSTDLPPHHIDLTYVLLDFPIASEQFIVREIEGLQALGITVRVLTLRARHRIGTPQVMAGVVVDRALPMGKRGFWTAALMAAARRPLAAFRMAALSRRISDEDPRGWLKAVRAYLIALHFADRLRDQRWQLVHAHFASSPTTLGLLLADWFQCPFGFSVHASDLYAEKNNLAAKVRHARHVFACSSVAASDLRRLLPDEERARVHTVHHGVNMSEMTPLSGKRGTGPLILAVGRFVPKKGFQVLLQACACLRDQNFDFRCEIVGTGPEEAMLSRQIAALGLDQVLLKPWCNPAELGNHYCRASVLAVPSITAANLDRDNIPNVVLEAFLHGTPVVASALSALSAVPGLNDAAMLVPPGDAGALADSLRKVCNDHDLARHLRERGRQVVASQFDMRTTALEMVEHFARATSDGRGIGERA